MASHNNKPNGLSYNEAMVEGIPSRGRRGWQAVVAEWKWIAAMLAPFVMALALYFIPATRGELETVRKDAAANLDITKAAFAGQNEAVKVKIDLLQGAISDTKSDVKEMRSDLKEVLKRLPESRRDDSSPPVAAVLPSPQQIPAKDPSPKKTKKKPATAEARSSSFWIWPR